MKTSKKTKGYFVPIIFILIPLIYMFFAGSNEAFVRAFSLAVLFPLATFIVMYYAISPSTQMIKSNAKLNQPCYSNKTRARVILYSRLFLLLLGIGLLYISFQIERDVISLLKNQEMKLVRGYSDLNNTPVGLWFASQSIVLDEGRKPRENYILLFSPKHRIKLNTFYEFKILPYSKFILEAREIKESL